MSRSVMVIDASKCLNCKACLIACQQQNGVPYGMFRNWVRETPDESSLTGYSYQPGACMHCAEPLCVDACPTHATYKDSEGIIVVDASRCIGCGSCVSACPYSARHIDPTRRVVDKCDYCTAAREHGQEPACVRVCTTRTRIFGNADDPGSSVSKALAAHKAVYVESATTPTKPTLTYVSAMADTSWPKEVQLSNQAVLMGAVATGVRWLGALSLFGVVGVFIKQLVCPSDDVSHGVAEPHTPSDVEASYTDHESLTGQADHESQTGQADHESQEKTQPQQEPQNKGNDL